MGMYVRKKEKKFHKTALTAKVRVWTQPPSSSLSGLRLIFGSEGISGAGI